MHYLWGRGRIGHDLGAYLRSFQIDDRNAIARSLASRHGCPVGLVDEAWAVSVGGIADAGEFDKLTQSDPAVMGWTEDRRARCPTSVALRNALNALAPGEQDGLTFAVAAPFLPPGARDEDVCGRRELVARDGRHVVFDETHSQWRLGEFTP